MADEPLSQEPITQAELEQVNIGFRGASEDPGPFLQWPLPAHIDVTDIARLPDSPWTHNFLGITDCPAYPALIDEGVWYSNNHLGPFPSNRDKILPGVSDDQVRWHNKDNIGVFYNAFNCYGANSAFGLPDHAGTDFQANNGTDVYAAADSDRIVVGTDGAGDKYVILRHQNVNGTGQTWYTIYLHLSSTTYGNGSYNVDIASRSIIGSVGQTHLHFQVSQQESTNTWDALNPWGIDEAPWTGCLWLDQSICPIVDDPATDGATDIQFGHFSDLGLYSYPLPYVETLHYMGVANGYSDGRFGINDPTTREQATAFIIRGLGRTPNYTDGIEPFPDVPTSHLFYHYIRDAYELGIFGGFSDGEFKPANNLTRCSAAIVLVRALDLTPNYTDGVEPFTDVPTSHACYQAIRETYERGIFGGFSDDTFRPDAEITRSSMAIGTVRALPRLRDNLPTFHDVLHDHPFYAYIEQIADRGITNGCSSTSYIPIFCPDEGIDSLPDVTDEHITTRGQLSAFVTRSIGYNPIYNDGRQNFPDVFPGDTFYNYIEFLYEIGVVRGFSDGLFHPDQGVTRGEAATMVAKAMQHIGVVCPDPQTPPFPDIPSDSPHKDSIQCLKDLGVTSGYSDGEYKIDRLMSRAEISKFVAIGLLDIADAVELVYATEQEPEDTANNAPTTAPEMMVFDPEVETGSTPKLNLPSGDVDWQTLSLTNTDVVTINPMGVSSKLEARSSNLEYVFAPLNSVRSRSNEALFANAQKFFVNDLKEMGTSRSTVIRFTEPVTDTYVLGFRNADAFSTEGVYFGFNVEARGPVDIGDLASLGDVNCDGDSNIIDALFIAQHGVGLRASSDVCPDASNITLYEATCDVNSNNVCNIVDALFIAQCKVGLNNVFCPSVNKNLVDVPLELSDTQSANISLGDYGLSDGETVTVPLNAIIVDATLASVDIDVNYDSAVVNATSCTVVNDAFEVSICNPGESGIVQLNLASTAGISGNIVLANIDFEAVGTGGSSTALELTLNTVSDPGGVDLQPIKQNGSIQINGDEIVVDNYVYLPLLLKNQPPAPTPRFTDTPPDTPTFTPTPSAPTPRFTDTPTDTPTFTPTPTDTPTFTPTPTDTPTFTPTPTDTPTFTPTPTDTPTFTPTPTDTPTFTPTPIRGDVYEPDDHFSQATSITPNRSSQSHTIHIAGDEDWVKFETQIGYEYVIETSNLQGGADTYIGLFWDYLNDGHADLIVANDDGGSGVASRIVWRADRAETHYVKIRDYDANTGGADVSYDIRITATAPFFYDNFSDPNSGWGSDDNTIRNRRYVNGEYEITVKAEDYPYGLVLPTPGDIDYVIETEVRLYSGSTIVRYGLIFDWQDWDNYYVYSINLYSRNHKLQRVQNGQWYDLINQDNVSAINSGFATNRIKVQTLGDLIEVSVNGQNLGIVTGGAFSGSGLRAGLFVKTGTGVPLTVRFDHLLIDEQ